jgi:hypothetical protein
MVSISKLNKHSMKILTTTQKTCNYTSIYKFLIKILNTRSKTYLKIL